MKVLSHIGIAFGTLAFVSASQLKQENLSQEDAKFWNRFLRSDGGSIPLPPAPTGTPVPPTAPVAPTTNPPPPASLAFVEFSETIFNRIGNPICIAVKYDSFDSNSATSAKLMLRGSLVNISTVNASTICTDESLINGKNEIYLEALNVKQATLTFNGTLWAGSENVTVNVLDTSNNVYLGLVNVTARLGDNASISMEYSTTTGSVQFGNLPTRTILFYGRTETLEVGSTAAVAGTSSEIDIIVLGFGNINSIANNDFSKGLQGWTVPNGGATTVPHSEIEGPPNPFVPILRGANERRLIFGDLTTLENNDLQLCTDGIFDAARQTFRVFTAANGTTLVHVRYRFETMEYPVYFGTQYNDFFSITIRSLSKGSVSTESATMNGLGEFAFDAEGSTTWRNAWLPLDPLGDSVSIDVAVANVDDSQYDSCVYIDFVEEWKCESGLEEMVTALFSVGFIDVLDAGVRLKHESFWVSSRTGLCGKIQGPQDAFRHCYWNCRMAQSFGPEQAEQVGTIHEACNPASSADDQNMDLTNNEIGRQLGTSDGGDCETMCLAALQQNQLTILVSCTECAPGDCEPYNY